MTVDQAFVDLSDDSNPISSIRDGMGINYGASGLGSMVLANRDTKGIGGHSRYALDPSRECVECKLEEFFLTAWVVGDPAMIIRRGENRKAEQALYPDDPSNVHHSYLGDPVRFRNIHAGPKETHVFHLHAHQWVRDPQSDKSLYLDSQTISPGSSYTYQIHYGGSGNRNLEVGDSIFHCHLYPHFAQGMWAMWRTHDTFEDGRAGLYDPDSAAPGNDPRGRNLPDTEIAGGAPSPAVVPIPGRPLPPLATAEMPGYPFYIAGRVGHRPPQPPMDIDDEDGNFATIDDREDGGLPRHVMVEGKRTLGEPEAKYGDLANAERNGLSPDSVAIANRVKTANADPRLFQLATRLEEAKIRQLAWQGEPVEQLGMRFHQGLATSFSGLATAAIASPTHNMHSGDPMWTDAIGYPSCDAAGHCHDTGKGKDLLFRVNGRPARSGAPLADPCPVGSVERTYRAAYVQFDMRNINAAGWHDPQARIIVLEKDVGATLDTNPLSARAPEPFFFRANSDECVVFKATNLIPSNLNLDDFQVFTPTDAIGQHIHLVKFDVTSSDGSANGWNYEDATLSPDEVRERIHANNRFERATGGSALLKPKTHPMFLNPDASLTPALIARGTCPADESKWDEHPWCGAQTTVQRWWADPLSDGKHEDRTIRTVFTHDHLGPSSHQHHGFYAALVVEPKGSTWQTLDGTQVLGGRDDGGPTSWAANILTKQGADRVKGDRREFNLAFADYTLLYTKAEEGTRPIGPPNIIDHDLPSLGIHDTKPLPEGISTKDPGTQLLNYRNEPLPLRIAKWNGNSWSQRKSGDFDPNCRSGWPATGVDPEKHPGADAIVADTGEDISTLCDRGDMANAFSSIAHGDPHTRLIEAYQGDRVQLRLIQGAQEENHVFKIAGQKWLAQPDLPESGWMNGQQIGISEHFEFNVQISTPSPDITVDHLVAASATDNYWDGQWTLLRAYPLNKTFAGLARLRSNPRVDLPNRDPRSNICDLDASAPRVHFGIVAMRAADLLGDPRGLVYNQAIEAYDPNAILFFRAEDEGALRNYARKPQPLVLRAPAGACITAELTNRLPKPDAMADGRGHPGSWSYNQVPPIIDFLNFNDFKMSSRVGLRPQLVGLNSFYDDGGAVGFNVDSTVAPSDCAFDTVTRDCPANQLNRYAYRWYAGDTAFDFTQSVPKSNAKPVEFGVVGLSDPGDVIKHSSHGAIGALVIEPATMTAAETDCDIPGAGKDCLQTAATIAYRDTQGRAQRFREFVLVYQDDVSLMRGGMPMPNLAGDDDSEDTGQRAFNYRMEPVWARVGAASNLDPASLADWDYSASLSSFRCADGSGTEICADGSGAILREPETPLFTAEVGTDVRIRLAFPSGHARNHGFTLSGHNWSSEPWRRGLIDPAMLTMGDNRWSLRRYGAVSAFGPARHANLLLGPAGGGFGVAGDYLYRSMDGLAMFGGQWGIMRVLPKCGERRNAAGEVCK